MAKVKEMLGEKVISGFRDKIDFYYHDGIPCARRWPRSPGHRRTPQEMATWPFFTEAAKLYNQAPKEVLDAFDTMAGNSGLSRRDLFMRAYLSGFKKLIATVDELE